MWLLTFKTEVQTYLESHYLKLGVDLSLGFVCAARQCVQPICFI